MPTWCSGFLKIEGSTERLNEFKEFAKGQNQEDENWKIGEYVTCTNGDYDLNIRGILIRRFDLEGFTGEDEAWIVKFECMTKEEAYFRRDLKLSKILSWKEEIK